ncbi:MAG TPA: PEP/pyruvate-binding domain-containing protein [Polyangiales bacterium]
MQLLFACDAKKGADPANDTPDAAAPIEVHEGACATAESSSEVAFLDHIGCRKDFDLLASVPLDSNLPGARSVKIVIDQADQDALYFQNSQRYEIHYQFASSHLSGNGKPLVPALSEFNQVEYYKPDRRFILGAVTYYEGPAAWAFELSPYDTASADMIGKAMEKLQAKAYFGPALAFHPTSSLVEIEADKLPASIRQLSTDDIYAGTDYQPLTLGKAMGRLHFMRASQLETEYVPYRDIVVLDKVPNDISVVSGIITQEFQTPLSHINVLSQNRKTPNMGLRNATTNQKLKALDGKWIELSVTASEWNVREVTQAEADAYWEAHRPVPVTLPALDLSVTGLHDVEDVVKETGALREDIKKAVPAFGGKTAHYSILANTAGLPVRKAFAVPVFYYDQFMRTNGFYARIDALLDDATFKGDPAVRDAKLAELRADMMKAPVDTQLTSLLKAKLDAEYPMTNMRFRTSTNSEDLEGFPCAGCYESHTGEFNDWADVLDAIRETWASIWLFRTFEERSYYGVEHRSVGMGLLVHQNFPDEEANGVALTGNPFDTSGLEPALYVNVQWGGEAEVVHPPPGITSDEFLYFFDLPNRPITYISRSNLVDEGETVLSVRQVYELGMALKSIHDRFSPAYGPGAGNNGFYAMDIEFKFDGAKGQTPTLFVKQARPYPGRDKGAE